MCNKALYILVSCKLLFLNEFNTFKSKKYSFYVMIRFEHHREHIVFPLERQIYKLFMGKNGF